MFAVLFMYLPGQSYATDLGGEVTGVLPLTGSPFVVTSPIVVPSGQSLTIEAGVVIKIRPGLSFEVNGRLTALGTSNAPIYVTSLADDSIAGDTGGDGPTSGAPGQWGTLTFNNSTASTQLSNVIVRFGQQMVLANASPQWNKLTISSMSAAAVSADATSFPVGNGNRAFGCPTNGIRRLSGVITTPTTWFDTGLPYVLSGEWTYVQDPTGRLTLAPGVVVKFDLDGNGFNVRNGGQFISAGVSSAPVILTSLRDDSIGGDTNGDGNTTSAAKGDWYSLNFENAGPENQLTNTRIRYGGRGNWPGVRVNGSSVSVAGCEISSSATEGIRLENLSNLELADSTLNDNTHGLAVTGASSARVRGSHFLNNSGYALHADDKGGHVSVQSSTFSANGGVMDIDPRLDVAFAGNSVQANGIRAITVIAGRVITEPVSWNVTEIPYALTGEWTYVQAEGQLTLSPGVVVKLDLDANGFNIRNAGRLLSAGTSSRPVIFTSLRDDSIGGDTNGDGNATSAAKGEWYSLNFENAGPGNQLTSTQIRYGGRGNWPGVRVNGSSVSFVGSEVSFSPTEGIRLENISNLELADSTLNNNTHGLAVTGASSVWVRGSRFLNNTGYGIHADDNAGHVRVQSSTFSANGGVMAINPRLDVTFAGNSVQANGIRAITVIAGRVITEPVSWNVTEIPYALAGEWTYVEGTGQLRLAAGVVIKLDINANGFNIRNGGQLFSLGTSSHPVVLTSLRDDSAAGDTNGDGTATPPITGDWYSLYFENAGSGNQLTGTQIRYGGRGGWPNVRVNASTLSVTGCVISSSPNEGIRAENTAVVTVASSTVSANATGLANYPGSISVIRFSAIVSNKGFGVQNYDATLWVDATSNFWGAPSGPRHATNPEGTGDAVSDYVRYAPFLNAPNSPPSNPGDILPPRTTVVIGDPHAGSTPVILSSTTPLSLTATDDRNILTDGQGSGVQRTAYALDGSTWNAYTAPFFLISEGTHTVSYFSQDVSGHIESTQTVTVGVDLTPPEASLLISPEAVVESTGHVRMTPQSRVEISVHDALAGVEHADYRIDAGSVQVVADFFTVPLGEHQVALRVVDKVGNVKTLAPFTASVSTTRPSAPNDQGTSGGFLGDGTPILGSTQPVTSVGGQGGTHPRVSEVTFSPPSPVGVGIVTFTIRFSKPMGTAVSPLVVFTPKSAPAQVQASQTSFTGDTWTGQATVTPDMPSGQATSLISQAKDADGKTITPTVFTFEITIPVIEGPQTPTGFTASPGDTLIDFTWTPSNAETIAGYRIYRDGASAPLNADLIPRTQHHFRDLALTNGHPYVYTITAVDTNGRESLKSIAVQAAPVAGPGWGG